MRTLEFTNQIDLDDALEDVPADEILSLLDDLDIINYVEENDLISDYDVYLGDPKYTITELCKNRTNLPIDKETALNIMTDLINQYF